MPSRLSERSSARSFFSPSTGASPAPQHLSQVLTHAQARRRRTSASARARARARGFTLIETAISGIVVAGITASLLLAVRYSQMVSEGKAVGQQMSAISEGANRYMKQYSKQILALDARCAESMLEIDEGGAKPSVPTGTEPDCKLVLGSVTVANGFQPTVKELQDLELVRANDALMLPFSPGITRDKRTGEAAVARIAVAIRPVRHQPAADNLAPTGSAGESSGAVIPAGFVSGINNRLSGPTVTFYDFQFKLGTDADRDLPPTINGVSCYSGTVGPFAGTVKTERVALDPKDDLKVVPLYTRDEITAAEAANAYRFAASGRMYCRYLQQRYGMGLVDTSSGGGGTGTDGGSADGTGHAWTLESVVFNTQPYYFGTKDLPLGAAAQVGAALQEAGYAGRMSALKAGMAESKMLRGLFGHSQSENPILSKDGARGLPGILAAVNLMADNTQASNGSGTVDSASSWDASGKEITGAGLIQGNQITSRTAVIGDVSNALMTRGRDAALAVKGNLVMGKDSVLMAANVDAAEVKAESSTSKVSIADTAFAGSLVSPALRTDATTTTLGLPRTLLDPATSGKDTSYNFYMYNGTRVRLPRVEIGKPCATYGDIGMTRAAAIHYPDNGNVMLMTRFIAICRPDLSNTKSMDGNYRAASSTWGSAEYDALLAKYPTRTHNWSWFNASAADEQDTPPPSPLP